MKWFAKMIFDGGGNNLKKHEKSSSYLCKISKFVKFYIKKIILKTKRILSDRCTERYRLHGLRAKLSDRCTQNTASKLSLASCRGAILIEFAVCMPILIILLFYIHDLMRIKRYYSQTEFVAQQMANILQNISQKREGADRKINYNDIRYASSLAYLSMFPGTTRFANRKEKNPLGYVFCVRGNTDSTATVLWTRRFHMSGVSDPSNVVIDQDGLERSNVKRLSNALPTEIYPALKINPGETKIILECAVHYYNTDVPCSRAFGLRLLKLSPPALRAGSNDAIFFPSVVIFTPKPGLFDATAPS